MRFRIRRKRSEKGTVFLTSFIIFALLAVAGVMYVDSATVNIRTSNRRQKEIQTINLCEAGNQELLRTLWRPFETNQNYESFDPATQGASVSNPMAAIQDTIPGVGTFASGVINVTSPNSYTRIITVRNVGWIDVNNNGVLDANEPSKVVDITTTFSLERSPVFDYTYFINNYGWMDGFQPDWLFVNGDMRANGNFEITNGTPTVNGSVYASQNNLLVPQSPGLINTPPVKQTTAEYLADETASNSNAKNNQDRWRPAYSASVDGEPGTEQYEANIDLVFDSTGGIDPVANATVGAVLGDSSGIKSWQLQTEGATPTETLLSSQPTSNIIMPDLSDLGTYQSLSTDYVDTLQTYNDGTANPNFGQGAYVQTWNAGTQSYQTVSSNGNVNGSLILVGTQAHPIVIHGPVTTTQDVVIEGYVSGQGTLYAGRNVQIIGSVIYNNPPNFQGDNPNQMDNDNQKADILGLAARGSAIMGNPTSFGYPYPLEYMEPPFTLGRYDDNGNWIPPFNATNTDSTGRMLYQSVVPDAIINALATNVDQIDAVIYTNFCGGGNIGTGGGLIMNGSIITKNEAMVVWSLPMFENYDTRIRENSLTQTPLIDIDLPRSPNLVQDTWQDRGFSWEGA